jgi:hypothetical protein
VVSQTVNLVGKLGVNPVVCRVVCQAVCQVVCQVEEQRVLPQQQLVRLAVAVGFAVLTVLKSSMMAGLKTKV